MNENFVSIADDLIKNITQVACVYDEFSLDSVKSGLVFQNILAETESYIKTRDPYKSVRSDVPSICLVKLSAKIISPYLSILYNNGLEYGVFSNTLKNAEVVPIYINSKKNNVNNYKPFSVLSQFSKIFQS